MSNKPSFVRPRFRLGVLTRPTAPPPVPGPVSGPQTQINRPTFTQTLRPPISQSQPTHAAASPTVPPVVAAPPPPPSKPINNSAASATSTFASPPQLPPKTTNNSATPTASRVASPAQLPSKTSYTVTPTTSPVASPPQLPSKSTKDSITPTTSPIDSPPQLPPKTTTNFAIAIATTSPITTRGSTPKASPKTPNPSLSPPSPFSLPPSQLSSQTKTHQKIPSEPQIKTVTAKETLAKQNAIFQTHNADSIHHFDKYPKPKMQNPDPNPSEYDISGMKFLTIAGKNQGAVMEMGYPHKMNNAHQENPRKSSFNSHFKSRVEDFESEEDPSVPAYVNSNVQAVNGSVLFNSSCSHHDPGVRLSLSRNPFNGHGKQIKGSPNGKGNRVSR